MSITKYIDLLTKELGSEITLTTQTELGTENAMYCLFYQGKRCTILVFSEQGDVTLLLTIEAMTKMFMLPFSFKQWIGPKEYRNTLHTKDVDFIVISDLCYNEEFNLLRAEIATLCASIGKVLGTI